MYIYISLIALLVLVSGCSPKQETPFNVAAGYILPSDNYTYLNLGSVTADSNTSDNYSIYISKSEIIYTTDDGKFLIIVVKGKLPIN